MTTTDDFGIRVNLSGAPQAAAGLTSVSDAQKKLTDNTKATTSAATDNAAAVTKQASAHREADASASSFASTLSTVRGVLATMGLSIGVGSVLALASAFGQAQDEARVTLARITGITGSLNESRAVYRGLIEDSIQLRVSQTATLQGYTRIAAAVQELGGTSKQARQINEIVLATAKSSGIAADEAAAAARQFAQALGSGVLQGDELRSIMENNQELARQLAKGLNVSVSELRKLGEEGKLTADVVAIALLSRLPEIRAKLAEVPLTSADAWAKLSTVLGQWVMAGDQVEMKAGLIARAMNAIADGIEKSRKAAANPIVVNVRTVYTTEGGAAQIGPNLGRRDPAQIAAAQAAELAAETARRSAANMNLRARDNEEIMGARLGLDKAAKKAIEDAEKYADSVALGSAKIQKAFDKEIKALTSQRATFEKALTSGDPTAAATARAALEKLATTELAFTVDMQRKLAEAKKSEANKAGADAKQTAAAQYREAIAVEEAFQANVGEVVRAETEQIKRAYDARKISVGEYVQATQASRMIGLAQQEESVRRELELAQRAVARGDKTQAAAVAKYLGELQKFWNARLKIEQEGDDTLDAEAKKRADERLRIQVESNQRFNEYLTQSVDVVRAMQDENEQRRFELSLIGLTAQAAGEMQARRQSELTMRRALTQAYRDYIAAMNASDSQERDNAVTDAYNKTAAGIRAAADEQGNLTVQVQATSAAYASMSTFVEGFINAALGGFKSLKDFLKNQLFDWLKQSLAKQFVMQIQASVTGGVAGAAANALGGGAGGIGSLVSSLLGSGGGVGSFLGTMPFVAGAGPIAAGTGLAGAASSLGLPGLANGLASLGGAISGTVTSVLAAIPVFGWIALAAGAAAVIFGKRDPGFKIDNNLTNVGNPSSHFTNSALSKFDVSGRGTDSAETQAMIKPLITAVQTVDDLLVNKLLGSDVIEKIRANLNKVNNASSWEKLDKAGIEKGSKEFLMQRYGAVFDEVDAKIAASIRGFTGTSEALLLFIGSVVTVMQALKDNAAYFKAVVGETLAVSDIAALAKEGEDMTATLNRVVSVFAATNGVAALMGKDVATAFGSVGLASLEARQNLIDLAGGISALDSQSRFFYENFYTEQERNARNIVAATATVAASFAELNLAVPTTRAGFRTLVEAQDLTTEAGRRTWAALMKLAPAFDTVTKAVMDNVMLVVKPRTPGLMGPGEVASLARSEDYLSNFFSDMERQAMKLADAQGEVNTVFARYGLTVPTTREAFRAMVEGIDRSTESGRLMYAALMGVAGAFASVTANANAAAAAISVQSAEGLARTDAKKRIDGLYAIIDSTGEGTGIKLARKLAILKTLEDEYEAARVENLRVYGAAYLGTINATAGVQLAQRQAAEMAGNLALFTTLQAQYGGFADQMYELELWHRTQIEMAGGSAAQLLLIEQSYAARRNAILTGGVASGLAGVSSVVKDWLNKLLLNEQLSTLTPAQRLAEAKRQYESARGGVDDGAFTSAADAYLRELREMFASGADYLAGFNQVTNDARARIGAPPPGTPVTGGGGTAATTAASTTTAATAAAASSTAAAEATTVAIESMKALIAELLARTEIAVKATSADEIAVAEAVGTRIAAAIDNRATTRVI